MVGPELAVAPHPSFPRKRESTATLTVPGTAGSVADPIPRRRLLWIIRGPAWKVAFDPTYRMFDERACLEQVGRGLS